jgi:hypothetical protein
MPNCPKFDDPQQNGWPSSWSAQKCANPPVSLSLEYENIESSPDATALLAASQEKPPETVCGSE